MMVVVVVVVVAVVVVVVAVCRFRHSLPVCVLCYYYYTVQIEQHDRRTLGAHMSSKMKGRRVDSDE